MALVIFDKEKNKYVRYGDVDGFTFPKKQIVVFDNERQSERFIAKYLGHDWLRKRYIVRQLRGGNNGKDK